MTHKKRHRATLLPQLFEHLNPMTYDAELQKESDLAEDLRAQGFTVTAGH